MMARAVSKDSLRVLSLNLQQAKPRDRFEEGLSQIAALEPDVVLVQEADKGSVFSGRADHTAMVAQACGLGHHQFLPGRSTWATVLPLVSPRPKKPGQNGTGVGIASRYPASWHHHALKTNRSLARLRGAKVDMDQPRQVLAGVLKVDGKSLTVATTHLSWHDGVGEDQLCQVEAFLKTLPGPHLLGGDFNLRKNLSVWPSLVNGKTYPADKPRFQLDYLVSDLPAINSSIHEFAFSDHRGVLAEVSLDAS